MRIRTIAIGTLLLFLVGMLARAQQNEGKRLFEQGLLNEGSADFEGAIQIYLRIVRDSQFEKDSQLIGKTLIQLGDCYEELKILFRARDYYQKVVDQYGGQAAMDDLVRQARTRLTGPPVQTAGTTRLILTPFTEDPYSFAISPDGRYLVFQAKVDGKSQLWLQDIKLTTATAIPIPGTENAREWAYPFWKPDSQTIGFFADQKLKTIGIKGRVAEVLADAAATSGRGGGTWSATGVIVFGSGGSLYRIPDHGGEPVAATARGSDQAHAYPRFLPDGKHFVFYKVNNAGWILTLGSLDGFAVQPLSNAGHGAAVASTDQFLYAKGSESFASAGNLFVQRFDQANAQLTGTSIRIVDRISMDRSYPGLAAVSISDERLAYRANGTVERQFVWRDRTGAITGRLGPVDKLSPSRLRLSPDGQTVLFRRVVGNPGAGSVWRLDVAGGGPVQFRDATYDIAWSPRGDEIVFGGFAARGTTGGLFRQPLNTLKGPGNWIVQPRGGVPTPQDWSDDGFLLYSVSGGATGRDLLAISLGNGRTVNVAAGKADETNGRFSPNGKWVAYQSNEVDGRNEIFVQSFPETPNPKRPVSAGGGINPRWARGGQELYFLSPDYHVMVAAVTWESGEIRDIKTPAPLFPSALPQGSEFEITADGERLLVNTPLEEAPPIFILSNWPHAK